MELATINDASLLDVKSHISQEAELIVFEKGENISFPLKRMFTILAKDKTSRGRHAHRECAQVFFCAKGECDITLDDGTDKKTFHLNSPDSVLYMPPGIWGEQTYLTKDTILMVLCDAEYDEEDYLRDYDEFLNFRAGNEIGL